MADIKGFLVSQVGYVSGNAKKALLRGPQGFGDGATLVLSGAAGEAGRFAFQPWGACWGSHWWVADFSSLESPGEFEASAEAGGKRLLEPESVEIGPDLLYKKLHRWVGWQQYEKRRIMAWKAIQPGWFDAGALWQEVCSHAPSIVGLADLARLTGAKMDPKDLEETLKKVEEGSIYLAKCQDQALKLGQGASVVHDLSAAPEAVSSSDVFMAALAWSKAAEALKDKKPEAAKDFATRAGQALDWIEKDGQPVSPEFNMPWNQGWPEGQAWPTQWMTRYLMLALWSELLLKAHGFRDREDRIGALTEQILQRKVREAKAEHGLWGHYYSYDDGDVTEKGWSHGMPPKGNGQNMVFGSDMGAVFAHPLHCFLDGLRLFPQHALAPRWSQALDDFALHYFKPACQDNPFGLLPRGVFGQEGPLHFAGLWHGCNTLYGQAAALAFEFEQRLPGQGFGDLGTANLQWVCGLNAGLTQAGADLGCVFDGYEVPAGRALPVSMIMRIGRRQAGNWTTIKGSVCNGFSTGKQFTYDVPPLKAQDGPSSFTDEDWITHAGGLLMGLARG